MRKFLNRFWPVLYLLVVWFIFSSPYFIKDQVPFPSTYQTNNFQPWSESDVYHGPVKNGAMPDIITEIYPWKHFTIESLKSGNLPIWNPNSFGGTPHLANYQSAVFSPFNLLFLVLPFIDAWSLLVLLQPILAGLFMFLFLRELKVSQIGSLIGSMAFMFSGFIVTWMAYGTLAMAIAFLPLVLFAVERCFVRKDMWIILLPLSIAASFFSGHFQISLYLALYVFAYILFRYFSTKNIQALIHAIGLYLVGIVISLLQIIPTLGLYKLAARSELFSNAGGIAFHYLITMIAPDFYGNPVTRNDWFGYYAEWGSFIGIVPFIFALIALFIKSNKSRFFFFFSGIICLILTLDSPLQQLLVMLKLPIFSTSIPSRMIILVSFSFAVLAAFGIDAFKNYNHKKIKPFLAPLGLITALVIFVWSALFLFQGIPDDKAKLAARNFIIPTVFFVVTAAIISLRFRFKAKFVPFLLGFVLLMVTADSLRFATKWMPFDPKEYVFADVPVILAMKKEIGSGRMYGDLGAYVDTYYNLPSIEGYDPLYNKRYGEFIQSASSGNFVNAQRSVVSFDKRGKYGERVLDLMGVNIIFHPISRTNQTWAFPVWEKPEKYEVVYQDNKFQIFRNKTALPRAALFYDYEVITDQKEIIKRFYSENFDFRNKLILEEKPEAISNFKFQISNSDKKPKNKVIIDSYTPNKVKISVSTDRPGLLFLSDSYYPGWKVTVNGKEEKLYRADYTFRAVAVPQGESKVEFFYSGLF